jgi:putative membrane protein
MLIGMIALGVLVVWLVSMAIRRPDARHGDGAFAGPPPPHEKPGHHAVSAEAILAERLARGDIDIDDYHRRLEALRASAHGTSSVEPPK